MLTSPIPRVTSLKARWTWVEQRSFDPTRYQLAPEELRKIFDSLQLAIAKSAYSVSVKIEQGVLVVCYPRVHVTVRMSYPIKCVFTTSAHLSKHPVRTITSKFSRFIENTF